MNKTGGILVIVAVLMFSCQNHQKKDAEKIFREWQGKEIRIPTDIKYKILGRDTLCSDLWNKPYKIFTYIDSIGCTSCQLGLPEWKILIDSCRQKQLDVEFIFAVHSSDFRKFTSEVRGSGFDYPIIYDDHNHFDTLNHFPPAPYQTFLLDKDNKVLFVGSPANNPKIWKLYKKAITSTTHRSGAISIPYCPKKN